MQAYQVYGVTVQSDFPFKALVHSPGFSRFHPSPKITFREIPKIDASGYVRNSIPLVEYPGFSLLTSSNHTIYIMRFGQSIVDYLISSNQIQFSLYDPADLSLTEHIFLGTVLSLWLELHGFLTLHAASVIIHGKGIAFVSSSGNGKSTLAASLISAGGEMITDDLLPLRSDRDHFHCLPGFPLIRLWSDAAGLFCKDVRSLPTVIPGTDKRLLHVEQDLSGKFSRKGHKLDRVYLPHRRTSAGHEERIRIEPVPPNETVIEFVKGSYSPRNSHAAGLSSKRFQALSDLSQQVTMRRLYYPEGFEYIPRVRDAILEDLERA